MQLIQLKLKFYQIILSKGQTYDHISTHILTHIQTQTQETSTSSMLQRSKPFYYPALSLSFSISLQDSVTVSRHFSISKSSCWPIFFHFIPLPYLENFKYLGFISHVQITANALWRFYSNATESCLIFHCFHSDLWL